jgi:Domain of unknown function (DUF4336)
MSSRLLEFGPGIWICDGPTIPFALGFPYPTRMAVVRLRSGRLFVWSPAPLSPELRREVDALGPVRYLVSPNMLHHLFLGEWASAYPVARVYASPGLRKRRRDLSFDVDLRDVPDPDWVDDIDQVMVRGSFAMTEVVFFHRPSGTVLFADLIENLPRDWFKGWRRLVARMDGIVAPSPGAPREWRATFIDRHEARVGLDRILAWPVERVVVAHGECAQTGGADFVRAAFAWLVGDDTSDEARQSPQLPIRDQPPDHSPDRDRRRLLYWLSSLASMAGLSMLRSARAQISTRVGDSTVISTQRVSESEPLAQALGYKEDAAKVNRAKYQAFKPGEKSPACADQRHRCDQPNSTGTKICAPLR